MAKKKKRAERQSQRIYDKAPAAVDTAKLAVKSASCPFLDKLPAELRNRIYEDVFTLDTSEGESVTIRRTTRQDPPSRLSILQTCRQVNHEARDMFFALNTSIAFKTSADFVTFASGRRRRHLVHIRRLYISGVRDDDDRRIKRGRKWYKPWWETVAAMPKLRIIFLELARRKFIEEFSRGQHVVKDLAESGEFRAQMLVSVDKDFFPDFFFVHGLARMNLELLRWSIDRMKALHHGQQAA